MATDEVPRAPEHRLWEMRDFRTHLLIWAFVNIGLFGLWAFNGGGEYWPSWALLGWGFGVAMHGVITWMGGFRPSETAVSHEVERLEHHAHHPAQMV